MYLLSCSIAGQRCIPAVADVSSFSPLRACFSSLDRVRDVDELVLDLEALGHPLAEPPDAGGLGEVVPSGEEMDAVLARLAHHRLRRLARDKGVETERPRLVDCEGAAAGEDPDG